MKAVVIYYSKTGFTRKYANWIAEKLNCECVPFKRRWEIDLEDCDTILFGSWVRAGRICKIEWLKQQRAVRKNGRIIVFAVGAKSDDSGKTQTQVFEQNLTSEERSRISCYYLQGGLDYGKMGFMSRLVMRTLAGMMSKKQPCTEEDEAMLKMLSNSFDGTNLDAIKPIIEELK